MQYRSSGNLLPTITPAKVSKKYAQEGNGCLNLKSPALVVFTLLILIWTFHPYYNTPENDRSYLDHDKVRVWLIATGPGDGKISLRSSVLAGKSHTPRTLLSQAEFVRSMMRGAWDGYKTYAWGLDELNPVSHRGRLGVMGGMNGFKGMGASMVDAMSTLHLMDLRDEFQEAKEWVTDTMSFSNQPKQHVSFFETTIRLLGGLMSAYDLSGDSALLTLAEDLASRLEAVFDGFPSGIATNNAQLPMTEVSGQGGDVLVAELGSNLIEFGSLSERTGRDEFRQKAEKGLRFIHEVHPDEFLIGESVDRESGAIHGKLTTGAPADSYYEYLLKYWILGGKQDDYWRWRWVGSVDQALDELGARVATSSGEFVFVGSRARNGQVELGVSHLGCFYPGNVALGVMSGAVEGIKAQEYLEFAEGMMNSCLQLYNTTTGLGAEDVKFRNGEVKHTGKRYLQRPEVVESLFYLWRATHDDRWREAAWSIAQAIETWCHVDGGYAGVMNVMVGESTSIRYDDVQQSWFLAETLKYLFLIFEDDSKIDIAGRTRDTWVFNTEAHPVRAKPSL